MTTARLAADLVLISTTTSEPHVLLIQRKWQPFEDQWALPGGHLDDRERFKAAALREAVEETGLDREILAAATMRFAGIYDDPDRDSRYRMVSVAYLATLDTMPAPVASDDAADARWFPLSEALDMDLAFDHDKILRDAVGAETVTQWRNRKAS